ncbi:MAG: DUF4062 domain-containing protein [Desulfobacterales bacterium]|nr:DUF4062 domain-containing protein [Desulfobacterales bacterium]
MEQLFISSVQKELQEERVAVRDFVQDNDLLRQFFHVFLFEDLPPADRRADDVYLDEVAKRTAHRDLSDLVEKDLFIKVGKRGRGAFYKLKRNGP